MTWSCFYCTYDNDDDSATQCCLCGMPGNRSSQKSSADNNGETSNSSDNVVDLTTPSAIQPKRTASLAATMDRTAARTTTTTKPNSTTTTSTLSGATNRKRKLPGETVANSSNKKGDAVVAAVAARQRTKGLMGRKVPQPPKVQQQQRQSTLSFSISGNKSEFPHGHVFSHTLVKGNCYQADAINKVLQNVFGLDSLRPNLQPIAIRCALERQSQMVVLATGGGKSLCYQLPACLLGGVTIVISPLLALMKDQTEALLQKGIPAACINSSQTETENKAILERLVPSLYPKSLGRGTSKTQDKNQHPAVLLYVTPESIQTERMRAVLKTLYREDRLALFAVDEAHCLSTWGHDFRSSYRKLNYLRSTFPDTPCMALTATATPKVIRDITSELSLQKCPLHVGSFDRPNIFYKVKYKDALDKPLEELVKYVTSRHKKAKECSGIVYVHKREDTAMIARAISKSGITAAAYHAGLKKADRIAVQDGWSCGKIEVAVATVAFGMGIDRHCVRYVVHWNIPKTIEGFYQEAGRAGRDGLPSHSLLFYSPDDVGKYKYLIRMQASKSKQGERHVEQNTIRKLEQLEEMQDYCTKLKCRRNTLIGHFGGKAVDCSKTCDVCRDPKKVEQSMHSSTAIKDVRRQFGGKTKGNKKQPWNGQWDRPHGDYDEDAIANDWGDKCWMEGDLKITGPLGADVEDYTPSSSRMSSSSRRPGFAKASDILSKYESMEGRYGKNDNRHETTSKARSINIPEHLKASLKAASDFTTANALVATKKKAVLTSNDHAQKAKEIEERLAKLRAAQASRLKSLQSKTKTTTKAPPPPPAPLSFGSSNRKR